MFGDVWLRFKTLKVLKEYFVFEPNLGTGPHSKLVLFGKSVRLAKIGDGNEWDAATIFMSAIILELRLSDSDDVLPHGTKSFITSIESCIVTYTPNCINDHWKNYVQTLADAGRSPFCTERPYV